MSLLFTGATSHRVDLAAQAGSLGITRGTLLLWLYVPSAASGALATLTDPVASVLRNNLNITTTGTVIRFTLDLATTDLDVQAALANFGAWGTGKWVRVALQWATPTEASGGTSDQKLLIGDLTTGVAEPSSYNSRTAGAGALSSTDATSFWKIGNRRQNDSPAPGRIAYAALFDRSAGSQMTTAEMDAWFQWPQPHGAAWMFELGADLAGGNPNDLTGHGHNGTITGATVADHPPMNPFGLRGAAAAQPYLDHVARERPRARMLRTRRLLSRQENAVLLVQGGGPIIDGVFAIPITYGLSLTGNVSAAGGPAAIDGAFTVPITYGLTLAGVVASAPAAIDGVFAIPITYGLTATATVLSATAANGTTWSVPWRGGHRWLIPYQRQGMSSAFAKIVTPSNDFGVLLGPITGRDPADGVVKNYSGSTLTAFWASSADSDTALGAVQGSFSSLGNARFLPAFDAPQQTLAFAGLADRQDVFLIVKGLNDFRAALRFTFRLALEI